MVCPSLFRIVLVGEKAAETTPPTALGSAVQKGGRERSQSKLPKFPAPAL